MGRPFQEINWPKVDEYRASRFVVVGGFTSDGTDISYNMLLAAKAREQKKK